MNRLVVLDAGPLGLITNPKATPAAIACREWVMKRLADHDQIFVPEVADYEVRRELIRANKRRGLDRLNAFIAQPSSRYLPITTATMRLAAELWAQARSRGTPTADPKELDSDVILAAQASLLGPSNLVIATSNVGHLSQFVAADAWQNI